ncbi:TonB-dependent receptor [Olivibacter sp. SDN3]|uniref:SusC/RagA family TonB-linked outer membrane protein n=1 Tax=Olivibacter sp. SDN3 TaxID=2764720 RepID=UPI0016519B2B|nr:TonB-dependent receptor [Olivibacter sp. SDN3]QNL51657.1 TonB-dependent receptor [Olivibacter sp. SDN3]
MRTPIKHSRRKFWPVFLFSILLGQLLYGQQLYDVSGTVTDNRGEPLVGISVLLKGSQKGATTDNEGRYTIRLESLEGSLTFSYIGYVTQEKAINAQVINVTMEEDVANLDEVVVVGYGTQKKKDLTGSISSVSGQELQAVPATNVSNTLAGRLPGLIGMNASGEPGFDDSNILIRGISTTGSSQPLIVIDGVPAREGGFSRLDPNDIETFTVLKDASAAIYGARAANGVILVTTKRGRIGRPTVDYTFDYGLRQPTRIPKMLDAGDYATAINELNTAAGQSHTYTEEDILKFRDGSNPATHPNTDWFATTLASVSPQTRQNLSLSGGTEKVKYHVSLGHQFQDGYYRNGVSNFKQYNFRSNLDAQVTDNLSVFFNVAGRQEDRNSPHHSSETIYRYILSGKPIQMAYLPGTDLPGLALGDDVNPVAAATDLAGYQRDERQFYNVDFGFTHQMAYVTPGLSLTGGAYFDGSNYLYKHLHKGFDLYALEDGEPSRVRYGLQTGSIDHNMRKFLGITANMRLNYDRTFGKHDVGVFVAYEQNSTNADYLRAFRNNLLSTEIDQIFAGEINSAMQTDGNGIKTSRRNYFGRFNYSYADKYLLQFNWRYDGSSIFAPGKRYGFFPGISAGWRISQEDFMHPLSFINDLKLRGSYGQLGNDDVGAFQFLTRYLITNVEGGVFGGSNPTLAPGLITSVLANPNITWESATTYNGGLDAAMFNNKLSINIDYFYTKRANILGPRSSSIPDYLGLDLPDENIREVSNRGFELSANYSMTIGQSQLSIGGNIAYNRNKIDFMDEAAGAFPWQMQTGKAIGAPLLWEAIGIFRSQEEIDRTPHAPGTQPGDLIFRDVDGDGQINGNDRVRQELTDIPRITFGLPLNFSYKSWNINALLQGQAQAQKYVYFQSGTIGNFTQEYFDNRWTEQNPDASGPRLYDRENIPTTNYTNTYFLRDAAFLRLKSLQISYSLDNELLKRLPFSALRIYISGFNLLTFDRLKYLDPEANPNDQNYAGWNTPQTRVFNAGLNVTF